MLSEAFWRVCFRGDGMIGRDGAEDEIRVLLAEAVGALRIISESVGPLRRALVRQAINEARRALSAAETLADLLK